MSDVFPARSAFSDGRACARGTRSRAVVRSALLLAPVVAAYAAGAITDRAAMADVEPDLALLLRGMALIKISLGLAALCLVMWRFGVPVSSKAAVGYIVGVCALFAAAVLIWNLRFIPAAAVVFHLGLLGLLLLAWRDSGDRRPGSQGRASVQGR